MKLVRGDVVAGHFEVERHLEGTGPVETYLARHLMAGKKVRLKVVSGDDPWTLALTERADGWQAVEDDGLVPCLSAGPSGKKGFFFAFGWEQGPTMDAGLDAPLAPEGVIELGVPLAGALRALHEEDLVHGHLRPSEIVLCQMRGGAPRLLDPVVAPESEIVGTAPTYLAPEVVAGGRSTSASDVYALGMTLARAMNGDDWVPTTGRLGKLLAVLLGVRPALALDNPALVSWIVRMTAPQPSERPEARQIEDAFRRALQDGSLPTLPAPSPAIDPGVNAVAAIVLRPPGSKTAEAAGLNESWKTSVEAHGTKVLPLVDGTLLCRIDRGSPAAVATTAGLVVRTSQEHAFRASAICGLPIARDQEENPMTLLGELTAMDGVASRTPAGVVRFTARLAERLGGSLPLKPSGDAFVLAQQAETKRARRGGTLEMELAEQRSQAGGGPKRRKTSEIAVDEPNRKGRSGTLVMEPDSEPAPTKRKKGGTLEIVVEPAPQISSNVPSAAPALAQSNRKTTELFLDDKHAGGRPAAELEPQPTLEVVVDTDLIEATRTGSVVKKGRRATWTGGRRSS